MSSTTLGDALPDPLEFATLPPLSPTMERAFSEAFAEMSEAESVDGGDTKMKLETSSPTAPSERQGLRNCDAAGEALRIQTGTGSPEEAKKSADPGEAKRARRSAIEKKSRQRRQGVLRRMRDEVKQLENVYAEMAKKRDAATGGSDDYMMRGGSVMPAQLGRMHAKKGLPSVDYLQQKYSELSLVAHALEEDRVALTNLLQSHESFQHSVGALVEQSDAHEDGDPIWNSGVPRSSSFAAEFHQLSVVECYGIVRESYDTIRRFDESGNFDSTGANFMGWTDKRKYDQKTQALQYGFAKTFPLENAEELLMRTWGIFCNAASMEHMAFNSSVATRSQVLQTMNDDLHLIRRDHRLPNVPMTFVTVSAIFRIQTPKGFTLCMRSIPSSDIQKTLEPHEYYYDVFHWSHFNQLYDENGNPAGCEVVTGGSIADQKQLSSMYWLAPLDSLELTPLSPLSPAMQRAFCEAFCDEPETERGVERQQVKPKAVDLVGRRWQDDDNNDGYSAWSSPTPPFVSVDARVSSSSSSPCPAAMASTAHSQERRQDELMNMSPGETKKSAECADPGEAKRARRSAIEKKSRQRRQGVLRRMRDGVKQLESVYAEMALKKDAVISEYEEGVRYAPHGVASGLARSLYGHRASSVDDLQQKYSELSLVAHALEEDRVALTNLLQSHESFQHSVGALVEQSDAHEDGDPIWNSGVPRSSSFAAEFHQLSVVECYGIVRESYDTIRRFDESGNFDSTGANFMGWTDKRKYDQKTQALQYGFAKTFPLENAEELLMRTWGIFCNAASMEHMAFNSSVATRSQVLQTMNDDLHLIRRDHRLPNVPMTFVTVSVIFRIQTPKGFTLCMRSIPSSDIQKTLEPHEYYYDLFHWTHFNQLYDENGNPAGCEVVTGGSIADQKQLSSMYWLFELICSVLRWESTCVAPLFLKCA
ncbi:hypothetical protein BBJ28_00017559 [Nothophytophthora sp. Chile5]|nr:hypothetical protein BBJ28_00017559 [Nothophytophthora sp. Chile5]